MPPKARSVPSYVGITRAKRLLMLFTDKEDYLGPSRFLREIGF